MIPLAVIIGLAVARAVRLWRDDKITDGIRSRVDGWLDVYHGHIEPGEGFKARELPYNRRERLRMWLDDLLQCPWCLSGWLAGVTVWGVDLWSHWSVPMPPVMWFASWWVACAAYWAAEVLADADSVIYNERERRGIDEN